MFHRTVVTAPILGLSWTSWFEAAMMLGMRVTDKVETFAEFYGLKSEKLKNGNHFL